MNFELKITIDLSEKALAALSALIGNVPAKTQELRVIHGVAGEPSFEQIKTELVEQDQKVEPENKQRKERKKKEPEQETALGALTTAVNADESYSEKKEVSLDDVRKKIAELTKDAKGPKVKRILNGFGAQKIFELTPEQLAEFYELISQL